MANVILDELNKTSGLKEKLDEQIMREDFSKLDRIYIDLPLLKDIRMGLMVGISKSSEDEEMFKYLLSRLDKYNYRPTRSFTIAYPELKYSEQELHAKLAHVRYQRMAFDYAPDTIMLNSLLRELVPFFDQNDHAGYTDPVIITINVFPLNIEFMSRELSFYRELLSNHLGKGRVRIEYISVDPAQYSASQYMNHKILYIDDLSKVLAEGGPLYKQLESRNLTYHRIIAPICVDPEVLRIWKRQGVDVFDIKQMLEKMMLTECALAAACNFEFRPFHIPLPKDE